MLFGSLQAISLYLSETVCMMSLLHLGGRYKSQTTNWGIWEIKLSLCNWIVFLFWAFISLRWRTPSLSQGCISVLGGRVLCSTQGREGAHKEIPVLGPLPCCPPSRCLDIRHWRPLTTHSLLLGSTSASLSPPALCVLSVPSSWVHYKHTAEFTQLQAVENPLRHTGAFCCSWELCEVTLRLSA